MNIHLITYLTSKLFWIYTVFRYNTILYPKDEDTQKLFAYFCAYLLSCWGSMQWGTMYGDLIFELIALLIITVAYQADWQHHVWNTLMVYIMGILCDGIPIVLFQRYVVARNPVHHHMGPGTIVMGNFIFFLLEVVIERKVDVKRSYYIKNSHWLAMLSVPVISIIVCIRILLPDRRGVRSTIVLFLLFINVFIFYLHDEVQKSYIETAKQEEMKIQMSQYRNQISRLTKRVVYPPKRNGMPQLSRNPSTIDFSQVSSFASCSIGGIPIPPPIRIAFLSFFVNPFPRGPSIVIV